ncbi:putative short chain dehydrogenase/ reductase [Stachybotrys elegans]|uniref:Short chain dehydrogenase/ reductase n=1 Tax=Stachybotrys elegans TaxID=80388 RepID=A0A8K0SG72_9HYPO|nr:putative short chain dehydrogenase/ reductase [Stachybotrys elegans]
MSGIEGKLFVLTGAASGIARATATLLVSRGALVSLADLNQTALTSLKTELEGKYPSSTKQVHVCAVDVRSQEACNEWIAAAMSEFGQPIYGAANLAGVFGRSIAQECGSVRNITDTEFDFVMDVNVKGTLNCLRAQLPHMQVGKGGRDGGAIVNAASIAGLVGVEFNAPYVASKHAIAGITKTLAKEEGVRAIRANAIAPGIIATPMIQQIEAAKGSTELFGAGDPGALARKGDANEVAELVIFLLSPQSSFINGVVVPIEGGWIC